MSKPDSTALSKINAKVAAMTLLLIVLGVTQNSVSQAQTRNDPVTVASVSSRASANGTVVSIAADGPLNRAQTWQDREGYHVVVPSAGTQNAIKAGKGIKVRQLDRTLEIVIQTKPGANVTVQPMGNRLSLNIEGKLDPRAPRPDADNSDSSSKPRQYEEDADQQSASSKAARAGKATAANQEMPAAVSPQQMSALNPGSAAGAPNISEPAQGASPRREAEIATAEFSLVSGATVLVVLALGGFGLFLLRRRSTQQTFKVVDEDDGFTMFDELDLSDETTERAHKPIRTKKSQESLVLENNSSGSIGTLGMAPQRKSSSRMSLAMPASLYGAYKVDQEIGKLVHGQPHKMEVVASRAPDDRRAIEASLLKTLVSPEADEELRRRARVALEEYGFVARQSAALLLATDPYERTSAARMLGDVKSPSALPFLLEALYDQESLVRNQAVLSIGELRLPSAIGALLDIARKHPDVPGTLLSRALSACSLDGLDFFDGPIPEPRLLSGVNARVLANEITKLEPASAVQELAESADDEKLVQALIKIESQDIDERSEAIKALGQFSTRTSVAALARIARLDPVSSVRALAISSLAFINHESVFPAILIAMADESRGVRAAAARSLSRLSFDRSDAYMRVTETDDAETLRDVAQACIKAGIAAQGIDRLASGDHQAYEALSVVSLLLKANAVEPLLEAIANHQNMDVRLTAVYILGLVGQPAVAAQLRQLAVDCTSAGVKNALLETISKLEAPQDLECNTAETQFEFATHPDGDTQVQFNGEVAAHSEFGVEAPLGSVIEGPFDFEFAASSESQAEAYLEEELEPLELESSGLPAPRIA